MAYQISPDYAFSIDYYHVLGTHEPRMIQDNPTIKPLCDASFPGHNTSDPRCVNGADTRLLDLAFVDAGLGAGRLSQIRTAGSNSRSHYNAINMQLKKRMSNHFLVQISDVVSWSSAYGGQATASYGGSYLDVLRQNQYLASDFGPTDFDERNRLNGSGVFQLPWGFQVNPIFTWSTARPYSAYAGIDLNGDGQSLQLDRACVGLGPAVKGCQMVPPNSFRGKALIQLDLRTAKEFHFGERMRLQLIAEMFNLFNRKNTCNNVDETFYGSNFGNPVGYCGGHHGYGATFGNAYRTQLGFRFEF
jgi:hypothetical protein